MHLDPSLTFLLLMSPLRRTMLVPMNLQPLSRLAEFQQLCLQLGLAPRNSLRSSNLAILSLTSDSTARPFLTDIGLSAIQSGFGHSSRWSSSILEAQSAVFAAPIPERHPELSDFRSTHPCSGPSEIPLAEKNVYEITAREREIQETSWQGNRLHTILENEDFTQYASPTADLKANVHEHAASQSIPVPNTVIYQETIVQPVSHVNDTIVPVHRQPQFIAGKGLDGKETRLDDDTKTEPDDDAKTEPDDDAKTEPDDGINEKDVNAEVLAHAILDIPLPPAIVASVQLLGQRKRRNSCCRAGIARMRAKRRQTNTEESEEYGNGGIGARRMRWSRGLSDLQSESDNPVQRVKHLSRPLPHGSVPQRRKGHAKRHGRRDPSSGLHSQADIPSSETFQTSGSPPQPKTPSVTPLSPHPHNVACEMMVFIMTPLTSFSTRRGPRNGLDSKVTSSKRETLRNPHHHWQIQYQSERDRRPCVGLLGTGAQVVSIGLIIPPMAVCKCVRASRMSCGVFA
ncbi:hypothetical protein EDB19DRAFT_160620 [Suillus lakei]|nr:hypothetical protein EDB19DRAFT_160620 [Suillus lakei]